MGMKCVHLSQDLTHSIVDYQLMKESSEYKDMAIQMYEKNYADFLMKINKLAGKYPALMSLKKDGMQSSEELKHKVHIQFAKKGRKVVAHILKERERDKFCQTTIAGLDL